MRFTDLFGLKIKTKMFKFYKKRMGCCCCCDNYPAVCGFCCCMAGKFSRAAKGDRTIAGEGDARASANVRLPRKNRSSHPHKVINKK